MVQRPSGGGQSACHLRKLEGHKPETGEANAQDLYAPPPQERAQIGSPEICLLLDENQVIRGGDEFGNIAYDRMHVNGGYKVAME